MTILIDRNSRVLLQGITGAVGSFQTRVMKDYGTRIVAGVTPGKGGTEVHGVPVYNFVEEALQEGEVDAAISFVPARFAKDAALECIDGGIRFLVVTTEGIPDQDVVTIINYAASKGSIILGPDTPGLISPGKCKLGVHPDRMFLAGRVGVLSRSGSLAYEVGRLLTENGIGQSTVVGIGGGPLWGLSQQSILKMFQDDPETEAVVLLGEVGGTTEQEAAAYIEKSMTKPVVSLIVGRTAPRGAQMGHAGAIIEGEGESAESKIQALRSAGCLIAQSPSEIPTIIKKGFEIG